MHLCVNLVYATSNTNIINTGKLNLTRIVYRYIYRLQYYPSLVLLVTIFGLENRYHNFTSLELVLLLTSIHIISYSPKASFING